MTLPTRLSKISSNIWPTSSEKSCQRESNSDATRWVISAVPFDFGMDRGTGLNLTPPDNRCWANSSAGKSSALLSFCMRALRIVNSLDIRYDIAALLLENESPRASLALPISIPYAEMVSIINPTSFRSTSRYMLNSIAPDLSWNTCTNLCAMIHAVIGL